MLYVLRAANVVSRVACIVPCSVFVCVQSLQALCRSDLSVVLRSVAFLLAVRSLAAALRASLSVCAMAMVAEASGT